MRWVKTSWKDKPPHRVKVGFIKGTGDGYRATAFLQTPGSYDFDFTNQWKATSIFILQNEVTCKSPIIEPLKHPDLLLKINNFIRHYSHQPGRRKNPLYADGMNFPSQGMMISIL